MVIAAAIGGVASLAGGVIAAGGAKSAAKTQAAAADRANAQQMGMYNQTRADLMPYQTAGQQSLNQLTSRMGDLTSPFNMTQANLEATPGYQFNLSQGLKATNNALGARGLLNSGAVMKGGAEYATGLADNTYLNQFNMDQQNKLNAYNKLMGVSQLGASAAAQTGSYGMQTAHDVGQNTIGAGNALAAGTLGAANAIGGGIANAGNMMSQYMMLKNFLPSAGGGGNSMTGVFASPSNFLQSNGTYIPSLGH